tara:strand:- start:2334 stop:2774 length:441 start_codon:yes stop_codon:yes gene_type:complete
MSYKGRYQPNNLLKYKGNFRNIIYRSLWELKFMKWCDTNQNVLEWGSEEIIVPYRSPIDNRYHRYYPDFYLKLRENTGRIKKLIIEVKPRKQCMEPKPQKKKSRGYIYEVREYAKNQAKWNAAREYCLDKGFEFKILTEKELGITR